MRTFKNLKEKRDFYSSTTKALSIEPCTNLFVQKLVVLKWGTICNQPKISLRTTRKSILNTKFTFLKGIIATEARRTIGIKFWSGETFKDELRIHTHFYCKTLCQFWERARVCEYELGTNRGLLPEDRDTNKSFSSYAEK